MGRHGLSMNADRIEQLIGLMPAQNPYVNRRGGVSAEFRSTDDEITLYANGMNDPMFGWSFVKSFIDMRQQLPLEVSESTLLRTFAFHFHSNRDPHVRQAFQLRKHAEKQKRTMLHCMLLIDKFDLEHIAGELLLDLDVVEIYETLFWNVRDRLHDRVYINSIVYPETTQILWASQYHMNEDYLNMAIRAAALHGIESVKQFMGMISQTSEFDAEGHAKAFEAQVVSTAAHSARLGLLHQKDVPSISSGRSMVQSSKLGGSVGKDDDGRLGLGSFGMRAAVLEHYRRISEPDVQYRLRLQQLGLQRDLAVEAGGKG